MEVFSRISIRTLLSPDQASDLLRELIRPETFAGGLIYNPTDHRPFIGRSKGGHFTFRRRRPWHNSFTPIISGAFKPDVQGSVFEASIRLAVPVLLIVPVMLFTFGSMAVTELRQYIVTSGTEGSVGLSVFYLLFTAVGVISYRVERLSAERILRKTLTR